MPGILCFPGGWLRGDAETHDRLIRELVNAMQSTVIFVNNDRSLEVLNGITNAPAARRHRLGRRGAAQSVYPLARAFLSLNSST